MGILLNGKYYKDHSQAPQQVQANVGQQLQKYNIEAQGQKHDMDLIQPYLPNGKPNPDFAKYYPELAKDYNMEELL